MVSGPPIFYPNGTVVFQGETCDHHNASCNYVVGSDNVFSGKVEYYAYGVNLVAWPCYILGVWFCLSLILHFYQSLRTRQWWLIYTLMLGTIGEAIGWIFRIISASTVKWIPQDGGQWYSSDLAFIGQICSLIFSPAFYSAALYLLLHRISFVLGRQYSPLHHRTYTKIFVSSDIFCLLVQAFGGSYAAGADTQSDANIGGYIMVGGVFAQMLVMIAYTILLIDYTRRWKADRPTRQRRMWTNKRDRKRDERELAKRARIQQDRLINGDSVEQAYPFPAERPGQAPKQDGKSQDVMPMQDLSGFTTSYDSLAPTEQDVRGARMMIRLCWIATVLIFIRSIYRGVELIDGWNGKIYVNQALFTTLDGVMMALLSTAFNVLHPGRYLPRDI